MAYKVPKPPIFPLEHDVLRHQLWYVSLCTKWFTRDEGVLWIIFCCVRQQVRCNLSFYRDVISLRSYLNKSYFSNNIYSGCSFTAQFEIQLIINSLFALNRYLNKLKWWWKHWPTADTVLHIPGVWCFIQNLMITRTLFTILKEKRWRDVRIQTFLSFATGSQLTMVGWIFQQNYTFEGLQPSYSFFSPINLYQYI